MQIINVTPNTPEWHEIRKQGIGGSDAAAVLGMSKYSTPYEVWLSKRGELDNTPSPELQKIYRRGHLLEPAILQYHADETGMTTHQIQGIVVSDKYPFMRATLDGLSVDRKVSVNAKTSRIYDEWGDVETDQIPQEYLINSQHEMIVAGTEVHHIPVLLAGLEFRLYKVEADKELQQMIIDVEHDFWQRVQNGIEPDLTGDDVGLKFRKSKAGIVPATEYELQLIDELKESRSMVMALEKREGEIIESLKKCLGESDTLCFGDKTLATWKSSKGRTSFDSSSFKDAYPELYQQFTRQTEGSRRFLIK
jgi:putative phage-type endonuclease